MLDFVCPPEVAPFCVAAEYAPTAEIGRLGYNGGLFGRPADSQAQDRLGVRILVGQPDVGRPIAAVQLRRFCRQSDCVTFRVIWDTPLSATWDLASGSSDPERYTLWSFVRLEATSSGAAEAALQNVSINLGSGRPVTLAELQDADRVPTSLPLERSH